MSESSSNSDSSYDDDEPGPVVRKKRNMAVVNVNGSFLCNYCGSQFKKRPTAYKHVRSCTKRNGTGIFVSLKCKWCNLEFANRGNLVTHAKNLHGDVSYTQVANKDSKIKCNVCDRYFSHKFKLYYHIRRIHYNLKAKTPYADLKKVNQVWFERVLNSNIVVEIRKTGRNSLVIKKFDENTNIKVAAETNTKVIDLSSVYPTGRIVEPRVDCEICKRSYVKRDFKKHIQEIHMKSIKHHCNNCNRSFKRSYQYVQHVCNKARKVKGVTHNKKQTNIRITSVESLSIPI